MTLQLTAAAPGIRPGVDWAPAARRPAESLCDEEGQLLLGGAVAAVTGYLALTLLLRMVSDGRLHLFAYYCWAVGLATLVMPTLVG